MRRSDTAGNTDHRRLVLQRRDSFLFQSNFRRKTIDGFTLVELLTVIAIIGLLLQLLLPAVQTSRESARRTVCVNNIRQLAVGTHTYVSTHRAIPSGGWAGEYMADPLRGYGPEQPGSWAFSLLEYIEEGALRDNAYDINAFPDNVGLARLCLSSPTIFYCPSRRHAAPYPFKRTGQGRWRLTTGRAALLLQGVTKLDYAANSGDAVVSAATSFDFEQPMWIPDDYEELHRGVIKWTATNNPASRFYQTGVSYYRSAVRPAQIVDGLAKTYLYGEKYVEPSMYEDIEEAEGVSAMGDNQSAWCGYEWDNHRVAWNPQSPFPNRGQPARDGTGELTSSIASFGSAHAISFNMAYCDGSVRSVAYDIGREVHRASASRLDGDGGSTD